MSDFNSSQEVELINERLRDSEQARRVIRRLNLHWNGEMGWKGGKFPTVGMSEEESKLLNLKVLPTVGH